jgi:hypothetical protein
MSLAEDWFVPSEKPSSSLADSELPLAPPTWATTSPQRAPEWTRSPESSGTWRLWRAARLSGVAAALIGIAVIGAVSLFGGGGYRSLDRSYFEQLLVPASDSAALGRVFERTLGTGNLRDAAAIQGLESLLRRQQVDDTELASLSPPPQLRTEQMAAETSFGIRVNGLAGFVSALRDPQASVGDLFEVGKRLVASDVLWQAFVVGPAATELRREHVSGLAPPNSTFLASPDLLAPESLARLLARPRPQQTAPSIRGVLAFGANGAQVTAWQKLLRRWQQKTGLTVSVALTGRFDAATEAATTLLQQSAGLPVDGVVGPLTQSAMQQALGQ